MLITNLLLLHTATLPRPVVVQVCALAQPRRGHGCRAHAAADRVSEAGWLCWALCSLASVCHTRHNPHPPHPTTLSTPTPPQHTSSARNRHYSLATYILLRGITLLIRVGNKERNRQRHPWLHAALAPTRLTHGDTLLMCASCE